MIPVPKRVIERLGRKLCRHKWATIRFQHLTHKSTGEWGTWQVNECGKCGTIYPSGRWGGRKNGR